MSENETLIHLYPVWRDRANFIIRAWLEEEGRYEQLWARRFDIDSFELCCIPFFAYDLALGDVVETGHRIGLDYTVTKVTHRSGRYVFRVWFGGVVDPPRREVADRLVAMGALLEWQAETRQLLAVDASDQELAQRVADYLFERQQSGDLIYETGKTA